MSSSYASNYSRLISLTKQLTSYVNQGHHVQALALFRQMRSSGLPLDAFVFSLVLKSCATVGHPVLGVSVHAHAVKSAFLANPFVGCALVDVYGKCLSLSCARKLFDEIPQRNAVVWNAMISHYTHCGKIREAMELFGAMDVMPTESSFNAIILGLAGMEDGSYKAIEFYRKMVNFRFRPNLITLLALLPACSGIGAFGLIKEIHSYAFRNQIETHLQLRSGLVEAYGRSGCVLYADSVFQSMSEKDVIAWSSLISAYALHGDAEAALKTFREMESTKVTPDDITFLAVLKACSHAGLADEALVYFRRMQEEYGLRPSRDHYSCLVDGLSRAGRLEEAHKVIESMPEKPTAKTWGALLGACSIYDEVELAEIAARELFEIEPENPANYVLLGKIYMSIGRQEEALRLRREMKERGVKLAPGSSWYMFQD
ncbi:PREDICTED: putative pentatricopeptide repeat-containing protein At1g03510 [Tarenaya hassleriana]|uniref:putative pentatricopeptide repeat-containing protein At1g03510 n=1 Tax=Tarenaya hassleriana TaxID=28532 RepID=UPI00053C790A|nr:PREDICTED: putative pentatricopeptide repeat-containing protein At1g03510 [Tarenaya hassleriana]